MADLYSRNVNTKFSALTTTVALFGVVGAIALVGFETLRQMRRLPTTQFARFWKKDLFERQGGRGGIERRGDDRGGNAIGTREKLTCEDWEMGHLYLAREFHATTPSPKMSRWPLAWAWQAIKFDDWFYAKHTGMDTVVYVRFLRACMWWMVLQSFTTAPILLAIHFHYAVETHKGQSQFSLNDMSQASLSYLVTTTVCMCPDGRNQSTPCNDNATSASTDRKSQLTDYADCQHLPNEDGRKLLWVHLLLAWYVTFTWFYALWWIGRGSLRIRRRWVSEVRAKRQEAVQQAAKADSAERVSTNRTSITANPQADNKYVPQNIEPRTVLAESHSLGNLVRGDDHDGWRQRTLLVTNLPPTMRDEASIRRYFEEFLRPDDDDDNDDDNVSSVVISDNRAEKEVQPDLSEQDPSRLSEKGDAARLSQSGEGVTSPAENVDSSASGESAAETKLQSPVQTVVLVRKMNELSAMLSRRQDVLAKLEAAHIKLAQTVMSLVGKHTKAMRDNTDKKYGGFGAMGGLGKGRLNNSKILKRLTSRKQMNKDTTEQQGSNGDVEGSAAAKTSEEKQRLDELTRRLARFSPANVGVHMREAQTRGESELGGREMGETVWEALAEIPRELLDPYQPVTRLSSLFRGQKVPTIDYLLTKLNLLTALVTEMRARPPSSYEPTSTAFVTFRDPRQARMVWRELKTQIVVKVRLAPEVKDLDWERLMRTSFTGDIVRGLGVNTFFWIFTIVWVIPVALLTTSLFSVEKLEGIFPPLQTFFRNNPRFEGFISVTLPTIIVSLLTLAVPELIFQISKRAQGFVTFSALYDQCLCRYWKFVICNVVIFFCIGATTVQSIIFQLGTNNNVLNAIAFSFPTAAPFYISYMILGMGVHTGFELFGFMIPLIQHIGARKAATPRVRALKTLPRNFNRYYWLPLHTLVMSIAFLFAILNPLILPFALAYLWVAMVVFKKNFAYQYYRRFNEKEGVLYFVRLFRFSLDGLLLAQVVLLVFFSVTQQEGAYIGVMAVLIPLNVAFKLLGTRLWKSQCRAVEDDEANALCGIGERLDNSNVRGDGQAPTSTISHKTDTSMAHLPTDARASGRYPAVTVSQPSNSRIVSWWVRVQDKFHANGNERPSSMNVQGGHGVNAKTVTTAVAGKPLSMAKRGAHRSRVLINASKAGGNVPANGFEMRKSMAYSSTFPVNRSSDGGDDRLSNEQKKTAGPLASASARDLRRALEDGEGNEAQIRFSNVKREASNSNRRQASIGRSEQAPFLSGYEAIANHAPVPDDEGDLTLEYGDGEYEEMLSLRRREMASQTHRRRSKSRRSTSHHVVESTDDGATKGRITTTHDIMKAVDASDEKDDVHNIESESFDDSIEGGPLVRPHASVRWEDTPNNHARYNNPFYSVELDPFLWLPRDPLAPVDLCDTIEWHGAALVSSQGGQGRVGEWDEEEDEEEGDEERNMSQLLLEQDAEMTTADATIRHVNGDERIQITGVLAQRIQEAEDAEESANPADSIPRNQLDDFKRALDEDMETIDEETDSARHLRGRDSNVRSPRRSSQHAMAAQNQHHHHRTSSVSSEPYTVDEAERTPLTGNTPREELGRADVGLQLPPSPQDARQQTTPVRSNTIMSGSSTLAAARSSATAAARQISMKKALRAEVLEEEYLRTVKDRIAERKSRRSENVSTTFDTVGEEVSRDEQQQQQQRDDELPPQTNTIMARHDRSRRRSSIMRNQHRRDSQTSESTSPVLRSTSFTSAFSNSTRLASGNVGQHTKQEESMALQDLSKQGESSRST